MAKKKKNNTPDYKTIRLPVSFADQIDIQILNQLRDRYSVVSRFVFARCQDNPDITQTELYDICRKTFPNLGSHYTNCSAQRGRTLYNAEVARKERLAEQTEKHIKKFGFCDKFKYRPNVFGSRKSFEKYNDGEITKEEWKHGRLMALYSRGEAQYQGNRKLLDFDLEKLEVKIGLDDQLFVTANFAEPNKNWAEELRVIKAISDSSDMPVTFKLTDAYLEIQYDVKYIKKQEKPKFDNRRAAVDLNPNGLALAIFEDDKLLFSRCYLLGELTKNLKKPSNDPEVIELQNKRSHETKEIVHQVMRILEHYQVSVFGCEDLQFDSGDLGKGKEYNRLCRNVWGFSQIIDLFKKLCCVYGIKFKHIPAAYSSFIGNLVYKLPDPISAACELARRLFHPKKLFPDLEEVGGLVIRWKDDPIYQELLLARTWKDLYLVIKNTGLRYRVPIPKNGSKKTISLKSKVRYI